MGKKAIDSRIPALIRNGIQTKERSLFILVGDKAREQLPNLHYLMSSSDLKMNKSVLWAYKKKLLGFTSHRKKREQKIKKDIKRGIREPNSEDPFELFITLNNVRYVYYKETENILGNTYGMCILQDFEGVTPNLLARTIETVEGGGIVVLLLKTMKSLKQLYTMSMDIHARYRTESHNDVVSRFNERFLLSLSDCRNCLVVDDELNVLPISGARNVKALPPARSDDDDGEELEDSTNSKEERKIHAEHIKRKELIQIKQNLEEVQPAGSLVGVTRTVDQAKAVLTFIDAIAEKSLRSTVTLTASRGRGKSAALGIAIAAAIAHGYSNIFISSPSPENLKTLFEFIFKGFDALKYEEHLDYDIIQSLNPQFNKAIVRVNVFRNHRQTIQYIQPTDAHVLGQAELVVIDEAAAIPLPLVKKLMGPYLVFMASTINGYEGTGRSLSLKLIQQLREQSRIVKAADPLTSHKEAVVDRSGKQSHEAIAAVGGRVLREITLEEPIRYAPGDPVEHWLNKLLCLDATVGKNKFLKGSPHPSRCQLYYVNRDTLFSYHPVSEAFLHRMMALYVASHYKNSPNDLQLLSDAPAHQLYVLLPPIDDNDPRLPEPLCVVQLALEGEISKQSVANSLNRGERPSGDLIPWLVTNQFLDNEFATLSGARVVRIATHPDFMDRGYGSRALELLQDYFEGKFTDLNEGGLASEEDQITRVTDQELEGSNLMSDIKIRDTKSMPPLLLNLQEKNPHYLHYMGVSFGLTQQLFKFWKRSGYSPVYIRQTANELTGEYTSVLLKTLAGRENAWLGEFSQDFHKRFQQLLSYSFRSFPIVQGLSILEAAQHATKQFGSQQVKSISQRQDVDEYFTPYDLKRLESYANSLLDHHAIIDLLPQLAFLYFSGRLGDLVQLSAIQSSILLGIGLQHKSLDEISKEINLPNNQVMAMFAKAIRKFSTSFREVITRAIEESLPADQEAIRAGAVEMVEAEEENLVGFNPVDQSLEDELEEGADEALKAIREKQRELINSLDMGKYAIGGDDNEWKKVDLAKNGIVSVRSEKRKPTENAEAIYQQEMDNVNKHKGKKRSKK